MNSGQTCTLKSRDFLAIVLFLQFSVYTLAFFSIPFAGQVVGLVYFTFVPGLVLVKVLRLDELDRLETILISVGFSIAFLMIGGALVNQVGFLFGILKPLSLTPLLIFLNSLILTGAVLVYLRSTEVTLWTDVPVKFSPIALFLICLPILSIVGAMCMNLYGSNLLLMFVILAISLLFVVGLFSQKYLPQRLYPFAVLMIAIALLLSSSLISKYVVAFGSDISSEYFIFKTTQNAAHWNPNSLFFGDERYQRLNAMLSVTVLPTAYSNLLNLDDTMLYKLIFPLIFSLVPLAMYQVWQMHVGKKYAFIAAFLLMAEATFHSELLGLSRQMVAEFFLALLLFVVLHKKMKLSNRLACFVVFSVALVMSHYAVAEIFLFFIALTLAVLLIKKWPRNKMNIGMVLLFFVIMLSWYIYTSNSSTYNALVSYANYVYDQQSEFFNPTSRGLTVLRGVGIESATSVWNSVSRMFAYATEVLIVIGLIGLVRKRKSMQIEKLYLVLNVIGMIFLGVVIIVPGVANTLNMTRFYHLLLFFIAPLIAIGAESLIKFLSKRRQELLVSILLSGVLVPYFLFQSGFVYELTRTESWSLPLSMYRMSPFQLSRNFGYVYSEEVYSAHWMSKNSDAGNVSIYADESSLNGILIKYSMVYYGYIRILYNASRIPPSGSVYLNSLNVAGEIVASKNYAWNISEISPIFDGMSRIYSNGASEVYDNNSPVTLGN